MLSPIVGFTAFLISIYLWCIIAWAVLSTLISFRMINGYQPFIAKSMRFLDAIIQPALRPLRRFIPNVSGIDLAPIILIALCVFLQDLVGTVATGRDTIAPIIRFVGSLLTMYMWAAIILGVLGVMVMKKMIQPYHPVTQTVLMFLRGVCDPALRKIRPLIPRIQNIDASPFALAAIVYGVKYALYYIV